MIPKNMRFGDWLRTGATVALALAATLPLAMAGGGVGETFCTGDSGPTNYADFFGCSKCPCSNEAPTGSGGGCLNSTNRSATLAAEGSGSVTAGDLRFTVESANRGVFAILYSADNRLPNLGAFDPCNAIGLGNSAVMDGLRCVGGNTIRHGVRIADDFGTVGDTTAGWGGADAPGSLAAHGGFGVGRARHFQVSYREEVTFGCGTGRNTTNAVTVNFLP